MLKDLLNETDCYRELTNSIAHPIAIVDEDYLIVTANESFCRLYNRPYHEVIGEGLLRLCSTPETESEFEANIERSVDQEVEFEYSCPLKSRRKFMLSAKHLISCSLLLKTISFREVTYEMEGLRKRDDFISIASHELRSPISIISAYSQIIEREARNSAVPSLRKYAAKITEQSRKLISLASALLDVSKIETNKLHLNKSSFCFVELLEELKENFHHVNSTHTVHSNVLPGILIYADREKIFQVLSNLISNAIKYSPGRDRVDIPVSVSKEYVTVEVIDYGMGIDCEDQKKLFRRFSRTNLVSERKIPGSGLGLYISYEIIKKHNGRLWVESEINKGSRFCFTIPTRRTED